MSVNTITPNQENTPLVGVLLAIFAALFFSTKTIFIKLAYVHEVDPISLLCLRMLFSLPFFIVMAIYETQKNKKKQKQPKLTLHSFLSIFFLAMIGFYLASLFDFIGLQYIPAGVGRLILFLYPTLILLISTLFLNHSIKLKEVIALLLSYLGIALVCINDDFAIASQFYLGVFLVFMSAFCYAIYLTLGAVQIKKIGANRYTSIAMSISSVAVVVHFLVTNEISNLIQPWAVYGYGFALALFSTVLPVFFMNEAINQLGAVKTSIIGSFAPVATIVFAVIFLGESMSVLQILGTLIILVGIYQLKSKRKIVESASSVPKI